MTDDPRHTPSGPGVPVGPGLRQGDGASVSPERGAVPPDAAPPPEDAAPDPAIVPEVVPELTEQQLEALLFVAERPLGRRELGAIAGVDRAVIDQLLGDLEVGLAGRGIRLLLDGDRVSLATAPEAGPLVGRYVGADAIRLSPAALETLAIVAYRQPVTRSDIERIRGVDSDYTVRTLLHRRLIVELGRADTPGRPYLYGTGLEFLERFALTSLEDLPPLPAEIAARLVDEEALGPGVAAGSGTDDAEAGPGTPVGPGPDAPDATLEGPDGG